MAPPYGFITLICVIFLAFQPMTSALQCYVCNTCTSPSGLTTVSNSTGYSCTKTAAMVANAVSYVNRGYTLTSVCVASNAVIAGTGLIMTCCTTDGCNGSVSLSTSFSLIFALLATLNILKSVMIN